MHTKDIFNFNGIKAIFHNSFIEAFTTGDFDWVGMISNKTQYQLTVIPDDPEIEAVAIPAETQLKFRATTQAFLFLEAINDSAFHLEYSDAAVQFA